MKKHTYRTKNVNQINWPELRGKLGGNTVIFAVDVAKAAVRVVDDSGR